MDSVKQAEIKPDSWAFFDRIYCISLHERQDRREAARKEFAAVGLLSRVEFILVAKHPENPELGIFESHVLCLRKGLKAKAKHMLIFEDDVFFQGVDPHALHQACTALKEYGKWNALFLGCITNGSRRTDTRHLASIRYRCLCHAYAVHHSFAEQLVQEKWSGIPYDMLLQQYNGDFYALYPMCAFQGLKGTDNQTVLIDRARRFFGGLPFIQKMNELYQNHKVPLLLSHAVILFLITLLFFSL
ncbi:MAG: glycosyltransferase [Candidatus Electrothrix sp. AR4]|nr:glycosyltransferase [Candidatus Electrothrix sp. AR4]